MHSESPILFSHSTDAFGNVTCMADIEITDLKKDADDDGCQACCHLCEQLIIANNGHAIKIRVVILQPNPDHERNQQFLNEFDRPRPSDFERCSVTFYCNISLEHFNCIRDSEK
uniref:Uncharacterized protein n=1 Tax=Onchocerca volvulus TaxID=6282 RepID=A0A8R1TVC7_ONCVO